MRPNSPSLKGHCKTRMIKIVVVDNRSMVEVPFTADTLPAGFAQADLLHALTGGYRT